MTMTFEEWSDLWDKLFERKMWEALLNHTQQYQKQWNRGLD